MDCNGHEGYQHRHRHHHGRKHGYQHTAYKGGGGDDGYGVVTAVIVCFFVFFISLALIGGFGVRRGRLHGGFGFGSGHDNHDGHGHGHVHQQHGAWLFEPLSTHSHMDFSYPPHRTRCTIGEHLSTEGSCALQFVAPNGTSADVIDSSVDACFDFYEYANGKWMHEVSNDDATPEVLAERSGRFFGYAHTHNQELMRRIEDVVQRTPYGIETPQSQRVLSHVFSACYSSYKAEAGAEAGAETDAPSNVEAPILEYLEGLLDQMDACFPLDGSAPDLMRATGLWLRQGFAAPLHIQTMRSPRKVGERLIFMQADGFPTLQMDASSSERAGLIATVMNLDMSDEQNTEVVAAIMEVEDALAAAEHSALARETCTATTLAAYVQDREGLDAHIFSGHDSTYPGAFGLSWTSLFSELSQKLPTKLLPVLLNTPRWARSLRYLDELAKLQERITPQSWRAYFTFMMHYHVVEFLPGTFANAADTLSAQPQAQSYATTTANANEAQHIGLHPGALFPWHPLRRPAWHTHRLQIDRPDTETETDARITERCIRHLHTYMPETLDEVFTAALLSPEDIEHLTGMIKSVVAARKRMVKKASAISPHGKRLVWEKLDAIDIRVGVPPNTNKALHAGMQHKLKASNTHAANILELKQRSVARGLLTLLHTGDDTRARHTEPFEMRTNIVNAYYNPISNTISMLTGITAKPFFDKRYNAGTLYATLGSIVGHEISHSLDKNGIHYDKHGIVRDWLPEADVRVLADANTCFENQYTVPGSETGEMESGPQTVGEDAADNGGLHAALYALKHSLGLKDDERLPDEEAYNFYLMNAQMWALVQTVAQEHNQLQNDPHALASIRVNMAMRNCDDWVALYGCAEKLADQKRCAVVV